MGSKKLLLKQKAVAVAFNSGGEMHSPVFRPAMVRTFGTDAFPQHKYC